MKKIVILLFVSLFAVSGVFAQQRAKRERLKPEEIAKRQTETLAKKLELNDEQKAKLYDINLKFVQPSDKKEEKGDRDKRREEFKKRHQDRIDSIKAILTDKQKEEFDKHQKEMQDRPRGNRARK